MCLRHSLLAGVLHSPHGNACGVEAAQRCRLIRILKRAIHVEHRRRHKSRLHGKGAKRCFLGQCERPRCARGRRGQQRTQRLVLLGLPPSGPPFPPRSRHRDSECCPSRLRAVAPLHTPVAPVLLKSLPNPVPEPPHSRPLINPVLGFFSSISRTSPAASFQEPDGGQSPAGLRAGSRLARRPFGLWFCKTLPCTSCCRPQLKGRGAPSGRQRDARTPESCQPCCQITDHG